LVTPVSSSGRCFGEEPPVSASFDGAQHGPSLLTSPADIPPNL
jgi:hypothetical protein